MYIETSWPRKPGDYARLTSPLHDPSDGNGKCLIFWYHMKGNGIGRLNVYIKKGNNIGKAMFSESGNKGDDWNRGMVTVKSLTKWQVRIEFYQQV